MESIFHEKQEGSLCAQHCLNALLQGSYFTAVDLATLASQIDEEERTHMAEGGTHSEDYNKFIQQPSNNVDDSGYFSVQVIASALKVFGLELLPYNSQSSLAESARNQPVSQTAYICNFRDHWLTIRKLGNQWFNLNSLLVGPELLSDTFLSLFLAQLQNEGYSIFIVHGSFPDCTANRLLKFQPAVQTEKPMLISDMQSPMRNSTVTEEDQDLSKILRETLAESIQQEDSYLQEALSLSLNEYKTSFNVPGPSSREQSVQQSTSSKEKEMSEEEMLEAAIKMSMET